MVYKTIGLFDYFFLFSFFLQMTSEGEPRGRRNRKVLNYRTRGRVSVQVARSAAVAVSVGLPLLRHGRHLATDKAEFIS